MLLATIPQEQVSYKDVLRSYAPSNITELQHDYGASCATYEALADKVTHKAGVIIISGIGCTLCVRNDTLTVVPGKTYAAQKEGPVTLYRGVHGITSIILLADKKGSITLDAIAWCDSQDIRLSILDYRGTCIQSFSSTRADARLRRLQYAAPAAAISGELVRRKLEGQRTTLVAHPELPGSNEAIHLLDDALAWLLLPELPTRFSDVDWLRTFEGRAADAYFSAWEGLPIRWDKAVTKTIPPHWKRVTKRGSPLSKNHGARYAINPGQAILNYAYALLESQVRQSLNAAGFDSACGFLHSDVLDRDSLVYDMMELYRPMVDDLVLCLLKKITFTKGDYMTTTDGTFKWNPQLSRYIAASCRLPQKEVDAGTTWLRSRLLSVQTSPQARCCGGTE